MAWGGFFLLVVLATLLVTVPGAQLLWLVGVRDYRTALAAPAVGVGALGLSTLIAAPIGGWSLVYPLLLMAVLGAVIFWQRSRSRSQAVVSDLKGYSGLSPVDRQVLLWAGLGVVVFLAAYMPVFIATVIEPGLPQTLDLADAGFHLTGAKLIADTGVVNPLTALARVRTPVAETGVYYPVLWHAFVALLIPFASVGAATNAAIVTVGLIFWPLSLSALAMALTQSAPSAAFWAPLLALTSSLFPGSILFRWSMDPFGMSVPLVASALAVAIWWHKDRRSGLPFIFVVIFVGAIAAQPSTALLIAVIPLVALATALAWGCLRAVQNREWTRGLLAGGALLALLATLAVAVKALVRLPFVLSLGTFQRAQLGYWGSLQELMRGGPTYPATATSYLPWAVIGLIAVGWSLWLLKDEVGLIFAGSSLAFLLLYMASSGPDNAFRLLTGPWYKDYTRLAVFVVAVVAAAAGSAVASGLHRVYTSQWSGGRWTSPILGAGIGLFMVFSPVLGIGGPRASYRESIEEGYDLVLDDDTVLSEDAVYLLANLDELLPEGSYILGAPSSGSAFAVAFSEQYGFTRWVRDPTVGFLLNNLQNIESDPKVCEAVKEGNVSAVLLDTSRPTAKERAANPGLYKLDTSRGFELLESRGDLELWLITSCD